MSDVKLITHQHNTHSQLNWDITQILFDPKMYFLYII